MNSSALIVESRRSTATPFWKIAGGKTKLLPVLRRYLREPFERYFEPFVGGGSVALDLIARSGTVSRASDADASHRSVLTKRFFLSDANANLIALYSEIRDNVEELFDRLARYPEVRDERLYYAERLLWNEAPVGTPERDDATIRAARMLYLNRSCFNGLWRERKDGGMNVPFGRYAGPLTFDRANLRLVAQALRSANLCSGDFERPLAGAQRGDLVYLDPPYAPVSKETASFVSYSQGGFSWEDQARLCEHAKQAAARGATVVASNSASPAIREMWRDAGFAAEQISAARSVGASGDSRGFVQEMIFHSRGALPKAGPQPGHIGSTPGES